MRPSIAAASCEAFGSSVDIVLSSPRRDGIRFPDRTAEVIRPIGTRLATACQNPAIMVVWSDDVGAGRPGED